LIALGYKQQDAQRMLLSVNDKEDTEMGVEDLVRKALSQQ
jgi:Holliday junction resolvasome RuvABC DNA-binding subunit